MKQKLNPGATYLVPDMLHREQQLLASTELGDFDA